MCESVSLSLSPPYLLSLCLSSELQPRSSAFFFFARYLCLCTSAARKLICIMHEDANALELLPRWGEEPLSDLSPLRLPHLARTRVARVCTSLLALSSTEPQVLRQWRWTTSVHDVQVIGKLLWKHTVKTVSCFYCQRLVMDSNCVLETAAQERAHWRFNVNNKLVDYSLSKSRVVSSVAFKNYNSIKSAENTESTYIGIVLWIPMILCSLGSFPSAEHSSMIRRHMGPLHFPK